MKSACAASDDQPRSDASEDDASAASGAARGTGSNSENNSRPAKNPPICACQATLAPSAPVAIDPRPKMMLTPNHTPRKASTRVLRSARISDSAGTRAAASASPRLNDRKLPFTKAKRVAAAIVPDTDAEAPIIGATACSWVRRCASAPAAAVAAMNIKNLIAPKRRASALPNGNNHSTLKPIWLKLACRSEYVTNVQSFAPAPPGKTIASRVESYRFGMKANRSIVQFSISGGKSTRR